MNFKIYFFENLQCSADYKVNLCFNIENISLLPKKIASNNPNLFFVIRVVVELLVTFLNEFNEYLQVHTLCNHLDTPMTTYIIIFQFKAKLMFCTSYIYYNTFVNIYVSYQHTYYTYHNLVYILWWCDCAYYNRQIIFISNNLLVYIMYDYCFDFQTFIPFGVI